MGWQFTPFTLPLLFAGAVFAALTVVGVTRLRDTAGTLRWPFVGLSAAGGVWAVTYALQLSSTTLAAKVTWSAVTWIGIVGVAIAWPAFALAYAGGPGWLNRRTVALLSVVPLGWLLVLYSGVAPELVATDLRLATTGSFTTLAATPGLLLLAFVGYTYLADLGAAALLLWLVVRSTGHHRRQAGLVLVAGVVPMLASWASFAGITPYPNVDLTPVTFAGTTLLVAVAVFRHSLLEIRPVVRESILRELDVGLVVLDAKRRVVDVNEAAGEVLDVEPAAVIGHAGEDVLAGHEPLLARLDDPEADPYRLGAGGRHFEAVTIRSDRVAGPGGVALLLRDVSELMARQAELERQNDRLDAFASVLAHDLRNPLTVAHGRLTLGRETGEDEHFDELEGALERMNDIIDDVLELARQGGTVTETEPVELRTVADRAWANVRTDGAGLTVEGSARVEADPSRLAQLLENLFRNAREHVGDGVSVRVGTHEDGFFVEDDGPGIPAEDRESVFEAGYSTGSDGMGMGLAIVREITEAHGWTVGITSSPEGGARFEFSGVQPRPASEAE